MLREMGTTDGLDEMGGEHSYFSGIQKHFT